MRMSRDDFERNFAQLQASWGYEGSALSPEEGEMLRRVCMGEISQEAHDEWLLDHLSADDYNDRRSQIHMTQQLENDFEKLQMEARSIPEVQAYLGRRMTNNEATEYLLAAIEHLPDLDTGLRADLIAAFEKQLFTLSPDEAEKQFAAAFFRRTGNE